MSRKDDGRILVALRDGLAFRYLYGNSAGWGNSFGHWYIEHPDGRRRYMDWPCTRRLRDGGMIEHTSDELNYPSDCETRGIQNWTLTEAGQAAAAALPAITVDDMFARPKVTPPEKLEAARHKLKARKIAGVLTFNSARIRDRRVMFEGGGKTLTGAFASTYSGEIPDPVMEMLAPHLESFVDVDGKESLRITEAGIAATARKRRA
ncbi:hypothetical protein WHZ77_05975 [Bradyrhizobium sp. A5]|uniref:hypothetical protein n=1 Tax=Bradyrhizobium sp. A5 TaxID=3133696 RepID=UPI00324A23F4